MHAVCVGCLCEVARGRVRFSSRVRMIEAEDIEPARAGAAERIDVILRVDQKAIGVLVEVPGPSGFEHPIISANQQAAAFGRIGFPCVSDNG